MTDEASRLQALAASITTIEVDDIRISVTPATPGTAPSPSADAGDPSDDLAGGPVLRRALEADPGIAHVARAGNTADDPSRPIVQPLAGQHHGPRFYPHLSIALITENHYPVSYMTPEEGIAVAVLGLGHDLPHARHAVRFSPRYPDLMPDFSSPDDVLRQSQRGFRAVTIPDDPTAPLTVDEHDLTVAKDDGTLGPVGGVVSMENQMVYPGVHRPGAPVVTLAQLRKGTPFDLPAALRAILDATRETLSAESAVDGVAPAERPWVVEMAVLLAAPRSGDPHEIRIHAIRPFAPDVDRSRRNALALPVKEGAPDDLLLMSAHALGDGAIGDIRDVVYLPPDRFDVAHSREMVAEIAALNRSLREEGRRYALIGTGRWGSTDRWLGVPLRWDDLDGAKVQVEAALEGFNVESSKGTHFFREMVSGGVGYVHVTLSGKHDLVRWDALDALPRVSDGAFVRHARVETPLDVLLDGRRGLGWIRRSSG